MDLIWGSGGNSVFDWWSLHHMVWFIAITTLLSAVFRKHAWMAAISVVVMWETFECWVVGAISGFPFAGKEIWLNKIVGDTISDLLGFLIAIVAIREIRSWKKDE